MFDENYGAMPLGGQSARMVGVGGALPDFSEGFEEGPLTAACYYGSWALIISAAVVLIVGAEMFHPGAGLVALAYVSKKIGELLVRVYERRIQTEAGVYVKSRYEQWQQQQQLAKHEEAARLAEEIERDRAASSNDPRRI